MKIVSLFAGCGGLDLGFHKSGHDIVHASDFDKDSVETYNGYFDKKAELIDVHHLKGKDLPDYDLLAGGFPCQGFSVANTYRNKDDSRNKLYLQIVAIMVVNIKTIKLRVDSVGAAVLTSNVNHCAFAAECRRRVQQRTTGPLAAKL